VTQDAGSPTLTANDSQRIDLPPGRVTYGPPKKNGTLTKGDWIRIVIWAIPIVAMAGAMWMTLNYVTDKQLVHDEQLRSLDRAAAELSADQKVMKGKVTEIEKDQDSLIQKVEKVDEKIDEQSLDLAAIKEKLKIQPTI